MRYLYAKKSQRFVIYLIDFLLISVAADYIAAGVELLFGFDRSGMNTYFQSAYIEFASIISGKSNSRDLLYLYMSKYVQYFMVDLAFKLVIALILVLLFLVVLPKFFGGKTLGRKAMNCKLVDNNGHDASIKRILVRELAGTFLCYCFLGTFFGITGIISLICILATSRSLPDLLSGTHMVIDDPISAEKTESEELKENEVEPDYTEVEKETEPEEDSQDKYSLDEDDYKVE